MANQINIIGNAYKKFGLKHTSLSTAKMPHYIRFFKKHILTYKESRELSNCSLTGGTLAHLVVQEALTKKIPLDDVINGELIQTKINEYVPIHEKDKMKFKFILKFLKPTAQNHLENIKELNETDQNWIDEEERILWTPPVNTYWKMQIDLINKNYFGDLKNKFGNVSNKPLKKQTDKVNENRMGDWVYSTPRIDDRIFTSDLMQIALYKKAVGLKPFLSYASHNDRRLFTEENTPELKQENLDMWLKELMIMEMSWEKKLEIADGDLTKLAWLNVPDFSDIRKKSFWWDGVPNKYINRYLKYYE